MRTVHVRIEGRVQGVGYRAFVERNALALGLEGWVRNRRDGSVEAIFQGPDDSIDEMLAALPSGPSRLCGRVRRDDRGRRRRFHRVRGAADGVTHYRANLAAWRFRLFKNGS